MAHSSQLTAAITELLHRDGLMAQLGSEDGSLKLDWVDGVARLIEHPSWPEQVEDNAREILDRGIRHIIWAGMGGSVMAVRVLVDMGFGDGRVTIHPLDSTDPAALNRIVEGIAAAKGMEGEQLEPRTLFEDTMMIGVAMGMTSEEPISHLEWFTGLLDEGGLDPSRHLLVMTLPGSLLDNFARDRGAPSLPLQLDGGTGTGGRMSAPSTRVFLLPVALWLAGQFPRGTLHAVLAEAWRWHDLEGAAANPEGHPFVRLAATLGAGATEGCCLLMLDLPDGWKPVLPWVEQLMEESLGKGGKGVVVFEAQALNPEGPGFRAAGTLRVAFTNSTPERDDGMVLVLSYLSARDPLERLAALAATFLGWQLCMALFGRLHDIPFAGQPAVEDYKARTRALREDGNPMRSLDHVLCEAGSGIRLYVPPTIGLETDDTPTEVFAAALADMVGRPEGLGYVDITMNGEAPPSWVETWTLIREIANRQLGVPVKIRRAPAAYHSTEQSEMDGPPGIVSLRMLLTEYEIALAGNYDVTFLQAQAVATWRAMCDMHRTCFLLVAEGDADEIGGTLERLLAKIQESLIDMFS